MASLQAISLAQIERDGPAVAEHADRAVAPGLLAEPLDRVVDVLSLLLAPVRDVAFAVDGAASVDLAESASNEFGMCAR